MEMNDELRKDAELGRKAKIAEEFFKEFLDDRRENLIKTLEYTIYTGRESGLVDTLAELRVIKMFRSNCDYLIQRGEIAEEELRNGE